MSKSSKIVDVNYSHIIHETDLAYLFLFDVSEVWLPKSAVEVDEKDKVVSMPEGLCIQKKLDGYIV